MRPLGVLVFVVLPAGLAFPAAKQALLLDAGARAGAATNTSVSAQYEGSEGTGSTRVLLLTLCEGYHGSTALEQLLMSGSNGLATLCKANQWQCEGDNVLCIDADNEGNNCKYEWARNHWTASYHWDYNVALREWSNIWDLRKPVLLEKTPSQWLRIEGMTAGIRAATLPTSMTSIGITGLKLKMVLLWRPWCLGLLSSHTREKIADLKKEFGEAEGFDRWLINEHNLAENMVSKHAHLESLGAEILVVSYADLIWDSESTIKRLEAFVPELGTLNANYIPTQGGPHPDIYKGNRWKVDGSLAEYGRTNDPSRFGYSLQEKECTNTAKGFDSLAPDRAQKARDSYGYLKKYSINELH